MTSFAKILKNRALNWSIFDQVLVSGSNFVTTALVARLLGVENFGIFATFWLVLLFVNSIHGALIVFPMMSLMPIQQNKASYSASLYLHQILFLLVTFLVIAPLLMTMFYSLNINISSQEIILLSIVILGYHAQDFYRRYLFAMLKYSQAFFADSLTHILRLVILFGFLISHDKTNLTDISFVYIATFALSILYGHFNYAYSWNGKEYKNDLLQHWKLSKWLLPSGLMQWSSLNVFVFMAAYIIGPVAVGAIRVGQNIAMAFNVILQGLENFIPGEASKVFQENGEDALRGYLLKVSKYTLSACMTFGVLVSLFAEPLVAIIYGSEYVAFSYIIPWFAVFINFTLMLILIRVYLRAVNKTKILFKAYYITSILSVIIVYPLEKYYGINGMLIGMLIANMSLISSGVYFIKKQWVIDAY